MAKTWTACRQIGHPDRAHWCMNWPLARDPFAGTCPHGNAGVVCLTCEYARTLPQEETARPNSDDPGCDHYVPGPASDRGACMSDGHYECQRHHFGPGCQRYRMERADAERPFPPVVLLRSPRAPRRDPNAAMPNEVHRG